jgi:hypothetical protein
MTNTIMEKSLRVRNEEAILKLEQRRSVRMWAQNNTVMPLPTYIKPKRLPLTAGVYNMLRQMLP